jgi:hypothetical protein
MVLVMTYPVIFFRHVHPTLFHALDGSIIELSPIDLGYHANDGLDEIVEDLQSYAAYLNGSFGDMYVYTLFLSTASLIRRSLPLVESNSSVSSASAINCTGDPPFFLLGRTSSFCRLRRADS